MTSTPDIPNTCLNKSEQGDACGSCDECNAMCLELHGLPRKYHEYAAIEANSLIKAIDEMIADMSYPPELLAMAESDSKTEQCEAYYNHVYDLVLSDLTGEAMFDPS